MSQLPWHVTEDLSRYSSVNLLIWLDNARLSGDNWMVGLIETELDARVKGDNWMVGLIETELDARVKGASNA